MLNKGAQITAKLIEAIDKNHWIVSFQGQLLQVKNTTTIEFKAGLRLRLEVVSVSPLQLKVMARSHKLRIDVRA